MRACAQSFGEDTHNKLGEDGSRAAALYGAGVLDGGCVDVGRSGSGFGAGVTIGPRAKFCSWRSSCLATMSAMAAIATQKMSQSTYISPADLPLGAGPVSTLTPGNRERVRMPTYCGGNLSSQLDQTRLGARLFVRRDAVHKPVK